MMKFNRVFHPVMQWEEIAANMWGEVADAKAMLDQAIAFTADHELYGRFMLRVVCEWPVSCENALTDSSLNQKAWVGHAACAMALNCPEDITRKAWGFLTDEQRLLANKKAESAIRVWRERYAKDKQICFDVGTPMLF